VNASPSAETYVACLTAAGVGAIATLAVRGPRAWEVVRDLFRPMYANQKLPDVIEVGRIWLGRFGLDVADEVVVCAKAVQPWPWIEVHCHGGPEVVHMLLEAFAARGISSCSWQHFLASSNDSPCRAAAATALASACTARTAAILLDQYQGAFERVHAALHEAWERGEREEVRRLLEGLAQQTKLGRHLTAPWRVVVAGAPNVGKSSLVNALAGYPRCVVSATPGTTRDVVTTLLAVDGWPIELADTAGLREGGEHLEQEGIGLARTALHNANLCLWVLDAAAPPVWPDSPQEMIYVINKVDLPPVWDLSQAAAAVQTSARTGAGLEELCQALSQRLVPHPPAPGAAVPFTPELCHRVEEAWHHFAAGREQETRLLLEGRATVGQDSNPV
jgi:tRNA modification GTPase